MNGIVASAILSNEIKLQSDLLISVRPKWRETVEVIFTTITAQKMTFSMKDFFSKHDQILRKLDLVTFPKSSVENFMFCSFSVLLY